MTHYWQRVEKMRNRTKRKQRKEQSGEETGTTDATTITREKQAGTFASLHKINALQGEFRPVSQDTRQTEVGNFIGG